MHTRPLLITILIAMVVGPHAYAQPADWTRVDTRPDDSTARILLQIK